MEKEGFGDRHAQKESIMQWGNRDQADTSRIQGTSKVASQPPEARERQGADSPSQT
jgi:hypothetical protein